MRESRPERAREALDTAQRRERQRPGGRQRCGQARARGAGKQLALERASGEAQRAQLTLSSLMGLADGTPLRLPAQLDPARDEETEDPSRWLDEARARHPSILAARAQADRPVAGRQRAREGLPTLDASAAPPCRRPDQGSICQRPGPPTAQADAAVVNSTALATYLPHPQACSSRSPRPARGRRASRSRSRCCALHADALSARRTPPAAAEAWPQAARGRQRQRCAPVTIGGVADISELLSSQSLLAGGLVLEHGAWLACSAVCGCWPARRVMQQVEAPVGAVTVR